MACHSMSIVYMTAHVGMCLATLQPASGRLWGSKMLDYQRILQCSVAKAYPTQHDQRYGVHSDRLVDLTPSSLESF